MTKEGLFETVGNIDEKYLEVADHYNSKGRKPIWKRFSVAAACLILLAGMIMPVIFRNKEDHSPFAIMAYAMDAGGVLHTIEMEKDNAIVLPKMEVLTGCEGFLFSIELDDQDQMSELSILPFDTPPVPLQEIADAIFKESWYHEKGMQYFYFMPMELEKEPGHMASATAYCTGTDGVKVEYDLLFMKEENEYTATLTGIKSFPALIK